MARPRRMLIVALTLGLSGLAACQAATPAATDDDLSAAKAPDATGAPGGSVDETDAPTDRAGIADDEAPAAMDMTDVALPAGGGSVEQALTAAAGQTLAARVTGVSLGSVQLDLLGPEGELLASSARAPLAQRNSLEATIVQSGRHLLKVSSGDGAPELSFDLTAVVEGAAAPPSDDHADAPSLETPPDAAGTGSGEKDSAGPDSSDEPAPKRIAFQAGAAGGSIKGRMSAAGERQRYLLAGGKDQILAVTLSADPAGSVDLMVFSPSQKPLRPLLSGENEGPLRFPLPEDGDYSISLQSSAAVDWTLELMLEDPSQTGSAGDVPAGAPPTRLIFAPGNRATRLQGQVDGGSPQRYILRAQKGDTLALSLESFAGARPQVFVEDRSGQVLASGLTEQPMAVALPASQDYWVTVLAPPRSEAVSYAMTIGLQ